MNYYPFHIGDYASATRHLTWDEDMAYRRLIDAYYTRETPIPTEKRQAYRLVMATTQEQRDAVDTILAEFFTETPDGWINSRCDAEILAFRAKSEKASQSAQARWRNAKLMPTESERNAIASTKVCERIETAYEGNAPKTNTKTNISTTSVVDSAAKRGTRLPADVTLPDEWAVFCKTERKDLDPEAVFQKFKDYWTAKPGKQGTKLDWTATWRNWVREERSRPAANVRPLTAAENYARQRDEMRIDNERTITGSAVRLAS